MLPEKVLAAGDISRPLPEEWSVFCHWAGREGWRVPAKELALYRNELVDSAYVLRDEDQSPAGFVTVCCQHRNAWIGNLIVDPQRRGAGLGRRLFEHAVGTLSARGVATLWLTASAEGRPLYENSGFREAGRVERWVWQGGGMKGEDAVSAASGDLYALVRADAAAWGHSRTELLSLLARGGRIVASGSTVALLQPGDEFSVLGPWLSADLCPRANRIVLGKVLESFSGAGQVAVDVMARSPVRLLLNAAGFGQIGETVLMVRGEVGRTRLAEVVALASLGSMG